jgi:hypothetical protein
VLTRWAVALANAPGSGVEVFSHGSPRPRGWDPTAGTDGQ